MQTPNPENTMKSVGVLHPAFGKNLQWIDDFAPDGSGFEFRKIAPPVAEEVSWHSRGAVTTRQEWLRHFRYALKAIRRDEDIIVTSFPQLAFAVSFWKLLLRKRTRIVAWSLNFGSVSSRMKGFIAGRLLSAADVLIVHSRDEIARYSAWLGLPESRFLFVPLQQGDVKTDPFDAGDEPFLVSLGSAGRDYRTLFAAVGDLGVRTIVVAKPEAVHGLTIPANVEIRNGLTLRECQSLGAKAALGVVPVSNVQTASGQVTFLMLMALGVPLVVTDCPGSKDYVKHEHDALMVPPGDASALRAAIERAWNDEGLLQRLSQNGLISWRELYSDEAAGQNLVEALKTVTKHS
ncbi:MAG: glycosyltransferase [Pseudomonadota bacterium]